MNKQQVIKTFTITADKDTMTRFEKLLCMMHYNGGHSGFFGMPFDGDGSDTLKCDPKPDVGNRDWFRISCTGQDIEIAGLKSCSSRPIDWSKHYYMVEDNVLYKVNKNKEREICRTFTPPNKIEHVKDIEHKLDISSFKDAAIKEKNPTVPQTNDKS